MEKVVINRAFWSGRRVLITGHTGFKGSWLSLMLSSLGAEVHGYALPPEGDACIFNLAKVETGVQHTVGDVRDRDVLQAFVGQCQPEIIFHLAAQALVRSSYAEPVETYATNVMGTVHLLEAARSTSAVRAVVVVTSDKCYENTGSQWGYRETDRMGGRDPYSNSKGCAELVASAYRHSFFSKQKATQIATARSGNVIGGGDWSLDRLVPDAMRAFLTKQLLNVRNPESVRPWQHVLDPLIGYLKLAELLVTDGTSVADAWNFGPSLFNEVPVRTIVDRLVGLWGGTAAWRHVTAEAVAEAEVLRIDCTKALLQLGWRPWIELDEALKLTVAWYRAAAEGAAMRAFTLDQIAAILDRAAGGSPRRGPQRSPRSAKTANSELL
jgi:CDP-glucose 4,6-dehydratase